MFRRTALAPPQHREDGAVSTSQEGTPPFRHLTVENFMGKLRAELFLQSPPETSSEICFSFGVPKSGWSTFEIHFVGNGHFICGISDTPNDFYGDLAIALAEQKSSFSVAAHLEPETFAFYIVDSTMYLCKFDGFDDYESAAESHEQLVSHSFMSIEVSREYFQKSLRTLAAQWPDTPSRDWAHPFPRAQIEG